MVHGSYRKARKLSTYRTPSNEHRTPKTIMWKKIRERIGYQGWRQIKIKTFQLPDGREAAFDILSSRSFVTVAAFTASEEVILLRQFRPGPERELISFPEGAIDPGETARATAHREMLEETGYVASEMIFLKKRYSAYTDQEQFFFLALDCWKKQEPEPDPGEFLKVELISKAEFLILLRDAEDDLFNNIDAAFLALDYLANRM